MDYQNWAYRVNALLSELMMIDFGYPLEENVLNPPAGRDELADSLCLAGLAEESSLKGFYEVCNGFSWPDVWNGYFIRPVDVIAKVSDSYDVRRVEGQVVGDVVIVGSSGGGDLFAIRKQEMDVLLLPAGRIENNTYYDPDSRIRIVASSFCNFAEMLLEDLYAFVHDIADHTYII